MAETVKGIFIDLGGTFREVDERPEIYNAARKRIADICKTDMDPDAFWDFINVRYESYREWALKFYCEAPELMLWSRWLMPELGKEYLRPYAKQLSTDFRLAKGIREVVPKGIETIRELVKRGYKVGIVSNLVGTTEIGEWLKEDGIEDLFCTVQQSSVTMIRKPHPAIFLMALDEAGVEWDEACYIGDNLSTDMIGARDAGLKYRVAVDYGVKEKKWNADNNPDCIVHTFDELLNVFPGNSEFHPENAERKTL